MKSSNFLKALVLFIIIILSVYALDGDPPALKQIEDLADEGAWAHNARNKALFGSYFIWPDHLCYGFVGGPLFTFLLRLAFGIGGVSFFSARSLTVLAFWGVLSSLYFLFRRSGYSNSKSLFPVFILGTNHLALTHARWATPIFIEILFLTLSFSSLILGITSGSLKEKRGAILLFCSGLFFSAAVASKLSAIYMLPAYATIIGLLLYPLRRLKVRQLYPVFLGAFIGFSSLMIFFLLNMNYVRLFSNSIFFRAFALSKKFQGFGSGLILGGLFNPAFMNPMVILLIISPFILLGLRAIELLYLIKRQNKTIPWSSIDLIEFTSFCWLIVGIVSLILCKDYHYRRYVLFLIPLTILFSKLIFLFNSISKQWTVVNLKNIKSMQFVTHAYIFIILLSFFILFFPKAESFTNELWISKVSNKPLEPYHSYILYGSVAASLVFIQLKLGLRFLSLFLVIALTITNLGLNAHWLRNASYTLRDASREMSKKIPEGSFVSGFLPWTFLYETKALPVLYTIRPDPNKFNVNFLNDFRSSKKDLFLLLYIPNIPVKDSSIFNCLGPQDFPNYHSSLIGTYRTAPFPGTDIYRYSIRIAHIIPNSF